MNTLRVIVPIQENQDRRNTCLPMFIIIKLLNEICVLLHKILKYAFVEISLFDIDKIQS